MKPTQRMGSPAGLTLASIVLVLAGLAGCGEYAGEEAGAGYEIGTTCQALTKKCGVDKYAGPQGADVSYYQGNFTWTGKGLKFGYARISDGAPNTGFVDPQFNNNWSKMKAAGILRGAYQFFRPGQNVTAQANYMVQKVGGKLGSGDMPCMIDVEATDGQSPATIASKIKTWLSIVQKGTGKKPIIYTGAYFWQDHVKDTSLGGYPLWIANYGATCPLVPNGWSNWTIWQYCDGQTKYCSNGQGFDRDVFNGTVTDLKKFAGASVAPYYAASYVNQSFPLATTALKMVPHQTIASYITLKNTGTKAWDSKTRLGTTEPKDRKSAFADSSWISPSRPAGVSGTVQPGDTHKFKFNLRAPTKLGDYHEYFGVLEEGVHWFSDPGQGGPPTNQLQAYIKVVRADWGGELVSTEFSGATDTTITMELGSTLEGTITIKNTGKQTWTSGKTKLAPIPRDEASPLADTSWLDPTRVSTVDADVPTGSSFDFPVKLHAAAVGDHTQAFGLVEEGVTWFADAPKGGGPPEDQLELHVVVVPQGAADVAGPDAGAVRGTDGGTAYSEGGARGTDGCSIGGAPGGTGTALLLLLLGLGWILRRRLA
jgi:lysozyme